MRKAMITKEVRLIQNGSDNTEIETFLTAFIGDGNCGIVMGSITIEGVKSAYIGIHPIEKTEVGTILDHTKGIPSPIKMVFKNMAGFEVMETIMKRVKEKIIELSNE